MNKHPPEGRRFKPGQSGNPAGARAHNKELKALRRLTKEQVAEVAELLLHGNLKKLQSIIDAAKTDGKRNKSVLTTWFAAVAMKGIARGDMHALDVLLNRLIGKVKDEVEWSGNAGFSQVTISLPDNGYSVDSPLRKESGSEPNEP